MIPVLFFFFFFVTERNLKRSLDTTVHSFLFTVLHCCTWYCPQTPLFRAFRGETHPRGKKMFSINSIAVAQRQRPGGGLYLEEPLMKILGDSFDSFDRTC